MDTMWHDVKGAVSRRMRAADPHCRVVVCVAIVVQSHRVAMTFCDCAYAEPGSTD